MGTQLQHKTITTWLQECYPTIYSEWVRLGNIQFVVSGPLFDPISGKFSVDGHEIPLTGSETKLVALLWSLHRPARRWEIAQAVWNDHYIAHIDNPRLVKLVSRLREKIEPAPSQPKYLLTVRGVGYKFVR